MSLVREIYQQVIVDHGRNPRNFGELDDPCQSLVGHNKVCGDSLRIFVRINGNIIEKCQFTGEGCAIALASASLLTEVITGLDVASAEKLFKDFHNAVVNGDSFSEDSPRHERLAVFLGVADYPARVKCATLAWQTLMAILQDSNATTPISTE